MMNQQQPVVMSMRTVTIACGSMMNFRSVFPLRKRQMLALLRCPSCLVISMESKYVRQSTFVVFSFALRVSIWSVGEGRRRSSSNWSSSAYAFLTKSVTVFGPSLVVHRSLPTSHPLPIYDSMMSPNDRPSFYSRLMEYLVTRTDETQEMSMVVEVGS